MNNLYKTNGDITIIYLHVKKKDIYLECLIDTEDFEKVGTYEGTFTPHRDSKTGYYYAKNYHGQYIHRIITDANADDIVDHVYHNTLDCRKSQLRKTTRQGNARNRNGATRLSKSGIRGVCWDSKKQMWRAYIWMGTANKYLGWFNDKYEAGKISTAARVQYFGSLAADRTPIKLEHSQI